MEAKDVKQANREAYHASGAKYHVAAGQLIRVARAADTEGRSVTGFPVTLHTLRHDLLFGERDVVRGLCSPLFGEMAFRRGQWIVIARGSQVVRYDGPLPFGADRLK